MDTPPVEDAELQEILPRFTSEHIEEKTRMYEQQIQQMIEQDRIPPDELADLIKSLNEVLEEGSYSLESTIQRWLEKAENGLMIKGNFPPLTLTGDYNDAVFPTFWTEKDPWWIDQKDFDHSFSDLLGEVYGERFGSWSNYDDTHRFFQQFLDREIAFRQQKEKERSASSTSYKSHYSHFKTTIRKGTTAWDLIENREILHEYQRRREGGEALKSTRLSSGWIRLLNRSVKLISNIKTGELSLQSDKVLGKIGKEEKNEKEKTTPRTTGRSE